MKTQERGVVAVEFALGIFILVGMIAFFIEIVICSYISGNYDIAIAEAARKSKNNPGHYAEIFKESFIQSGSKWLIEPNKLSIKMTYVSSIHELKKVKNRCNVGNTQTGFYTCTINGTIASRQSGTMKPIAIVNINYQYFSMFKFHELDQLFEREIIMVQEYERTSFKI